ncbi:MAG: hypothetical protein IT379_09785 [Deltaproteobacteria bacterium]|nr:hypothetical protein [Deltaproteobacteria bacterium]
MKRSILGPVVVARMLGLAFFVTGCGDGDGAGGPLCDRAALLAALSGARPGDTVRIGACVVDGPFVVGPGVRLEGAGADLTTIRGAGTAGPTVRLDAGEATTSLATLRVEQVGPGLGVLATGREGALELSSLAIDVSLGAGIEIDEAERVRVLDVVVEGPVTPANVLALPMDPTSAESATFGVVVDASGSAESPVELERLRVSGFAEVGVYTRDSTVRWRGGASTANRFVGLLASGGVLELSDVDLGATMRGVKSLAFGGVFDGCRVTSAGVRVGGGESLGLMHDAAIATHEQLDASDNGDVGVWFQHGSTFDLAEANVARNAIAGIFSSESTAMAVRASTIDATEIRMRLGPDFGTIRVGDGIQLVGPATNLVLQDLDLRGNARTGLLVELLGGSLESAVVENVRVDGDGDSFGAVAQGGTVPAGWDDGVSRGGDTAANDAMRDMPLPHLGPQMGGLPPAYPTPCD